MKLARFLAGMALAGLLAATCGQNLAAEEGDAIGLPHVQRKIASVAPLTIVAFGSSSTEGIGASSPTKAYPSRLSGELARLLPYGERINVVNRGIGGEQIDDMMRRLKRDVILAHPDLVIWQLGTNDVFARVPLDHFRQAAQNGIDQLRDAGIDVMLMEPQNCPALRAAHDALAYRDAVRHLARKNGLPLIRRYDLIGDWLHEDGPGVLAADGLHMSDLGYALLAKAAAQAILGAAEKTGASPTSP